MRERDVRWCLFGAQAAIVWGSPRLSADVDVTADLDPVKVTDYIDTMHRHGFDVIFDDPEFVDRTRVVPDLYERVGDVVDDEVVVTGGPEHRFRRSDHRARVDAFCVGAPCNSIAVDLGGSFIPVISPEDLIITKILAGRAKDIEDIRGVMSERRQSLDIARIRAILRLLEEALSRSDLLPLFEREWRKTKTVAGKASSPKKRAAKARKKP